MTKWAATSHDPKSHIHVDNQVHNYWLNKPSNHPLSGFGFTNSIFPGMKAFVLATKQNFVELCVYSIILHREKDADSNVVFQLELNIFFKFSLCV